MNNKSKNFLKWTVTILLVVVSLYFALKDINYAELWIILKTANYIWAIVPLPIIVLSHFIRAVRWHTILKPIHLPASLMNLFSAVMVGYFFNTIFPRLGEFVRPVVYAKREKTSVSSVFATIIFERVIDVITLGILFAVAFFVARNKIVNMLPGIEPSKLVIFSILVLAVIIISFYPPFIKAILKYFVKPISDKIYNRLLDIFMKFRKGFTVIKKPSLYFRLILESLLIWICYALPMYINFYCFEFHNHIDVQLGDALFLVIVSGIGVTIAPTPSGIGVMHYLIQFALMGLYGLDKETALAYATINHASSVLVQLTVGGLFTFRERANIVPKDLWSGELTKQSV
jgi:hypothetical protein